MTIASESLKNITTLSQVSFPVFRLTNKQPLRYEDVLYYRNEYRDIDSNESNTVVKLIDDASIGPVGLASRRLRMKQQGAVLYPLRRTIFFLGDFLKLARSDYWFIDSNGFVFKYKKSLRAKLRFRRIKRIIPGRKSGSILEIEGIPERFKTVFIVKNSMRYASILEYRGLHILYGVYDTQYRDSWRLI